MVYLATSERYHCICHEFYHDGYLYLVEIGNFTKYDKMKIGSDGYRTTEPFGYELPGTLNVIEFDGFYDRMTILNSIIEKIIFEKL